MVPCPSSSILRYQVMRYSEMNFMHLILNQTDENILNLHNPLISKIQNHGRYLSVDNSSIVFYIDDSTDNERHSLKTNIYTEPSVLDSSIIQQLQLSEV